MQDKKVEHYRNRKFGEHFKKYTKNIGDNKEVVEKLYNNLLRHL